MEPKLNKSGHCLIKKLIEKPSPGTSPSNLSIMGRYILTPEIFTFLAKQKVGAGGEIQLTDALQELNKLQSVYAYAFKGKRYDVGERLGFVKTTLEFALQQEDLQDDLMHFMETLMKAKNADKTAEVNSKRAVTPPYKVQNSL